MQLTISIDDVNPKQGYRIYGDKTEKWLTALNNQFGVKYTLFIPSNYHTQFPLSKHKSWVMDLASDPKFELAAHGHYHMTGDSKLYGECEWAEMRDVQEIEQRFSAMENEWLESLGYLPRGWRNPGWLCSPNSRDCLQENFDWVALHYEHNRNLHWKCKTFFGHDNIQAENISTHNGDMIMFQSHIAGSHNLNVWNEYNFEQLSLSLEYLFTEYSDIQPKTLSEC